MKLRNREQMLNMLKERLARMDDDTFFAQLGISFSELEKAQLSQNQLTSSYYLDDFPVKPSCHCMKQNNFFSISTSGHLFDQKSSISYVQEEVNSLSNQAQVA